MASEPMRVIQHFSCTGGTLFAKCIAAMPGSVLLSEINPLSTQLFLGGTSPLYCPTDVIALARIGKAPAIDELSERLFLADMRVVTDHLSSFGKKLILREHSHSSFLIGQKSKLPRTIPTILKDHFRCLSTITVRHPVDSYLSLQHNGWLHFQPKTFDEYCQRYLSFLGSNPDAPIFKYEHLVDDPKQAILEMCTSLEIEYEDSFQDSLGAIDATGDSGRTSDFIVKRERRAFGEKFAMEMKSSEHFETLCKSLGYELF